MAQFTVNYPTGHGAEILAAFKADLESEGVDTSSLSNAQVAQKWVARRVRDRVISYRRVNDATLTAAVTAAQAARTAASDAVVTAASAQVTAEQADAAQVTTDFAGDV
jgi:DNA-binding NtrC family response regulator